MRTWIALMSLVIMIVAAPAYANYKETYNQALEAIKAKNWTLAEALLFAASIEESKPKNRVRLYGMKYFTYLPYFNLGLAQFQQGKCNEAIVNLDKSLGFGVISKNHDDEFELLNQIKADCKASPDIRLALEEAAQTRLADLRRKRSSFEAGIKQLRGDNLWTTEWRTGQEMPRELETLSETLDNIAFTLQDLDNLTMDSFAGIDNEISAALSAATGFQSQIDRKLGVLRQQKKLDEDNQKEQEQEASESALAAEQQRREQRDALIVALRDKVDNLGDLISQWPTDIAAAPERRELEGVRQAYISGGNLDLAALKALEARLDRAAQTGRARVERHIAELASRPPEELMAAVDAYFKGDYLRSLELLGSTDFKSGRAGHYRNLFAAASQYQLSFRAENEDRDRLTSQAQASIRTAFQIEAIEIDARAFSPRFVAFAKASLN